jgi:NAD(P)-dependent dehydrogenase (short-subunit alcohol dehydrogenase family)
MKGNVTMVTGATAGIGLVTARELARQGATVVVVGRDEARGKAAVEGIRRDTGNDAVSLLLCDFSSQASIRKLAAAFKEKFDRLHVLVNNAGAMNGERHVTVDGLELTFAANHLGYFLLTTLLLDVIEKSAPARVVSVSSGVHRGAKIDFDDLQFEKRSYSQFAAYGQSKLANVLFSNELARRLAGKGVTSNSLHPGVIASNFGQSGSAFIRFGVKLIAPILATPEKGAATSIYLATSPEVEGVTGKYFIKKKAVHPSRLAQDVDLAKKLWAVSEELVAKSATAAAA